MTNLQTVVVLGQQADNGFDKVLKADKFRKAAELVAASEGYEFAVELAEMLEEEAARVEKSNARNQGKKRMTKAQKENEVLKEQLLQFVAMQDVDYVFTAGMLQENVEGFAEFSVQKVTALLTALRKEEKVERVGDVKVEGEKGTKVGYKLLA